MSHRQADFPARTRRLIAERAGYQCSKPDCRRQTLGPGTGPYETACIGIACHIYSAAPGGRADLAGCPLSSSNPCPTASGCARTMRG